MTQNSLINNFPFLSSQYLFKSPPAASQAETPKSAIWIWPSPPSKMFPALMSLNDIADIRIILAILIIGFRINIYL